MKYRIKRTFWEKAAIFGLCCLTVVLIFVAMGIVTLAGYGIWLGIEWLLGLL